MSAEGEARKPVHNSAHNFRCAEDGKTVVGPPCPRCGQLRRLTRAEKYPEWWKITCGCTTGVRYVKRNDPYGVEMLQALKGACGSAVGWFPPELRK